MVGFSAFVHNLSVPQGLAVFEGVDDALLRLLVLEEIDEELALDRQQPVLVDQRTGLDVAAAQGKRMMNSDP